MCEQIICFGTRRLPWRGEGTFVSILDPSIIYTRKTDRRKYTFFRKAFLSTYMIDYDYFTLKLHQFYPQNAYLGQFYIAK